MSGRDLARSRFRASIKQTHDALDAAWDSAQRRNNAIAALRNLIEAFAGLEGAITAAADMAELQRAEGETVLERQLKASISKVIEKKGGGR